MHPEAQNLGLAVDVQQFVMERGRQFGSEFKAADQRCGAFVVRDRILAIEQRGDRRQSLRLQEIEPCDFDAGEQCLNGHADR